MAELDTAVMLCLDPTSPPAIRNNALTYCQNLRTSSNGWAVVLQHLSTHTRDEVAFWCLQVLGETLSDPARYPAQFSPSHVLAVRRSLLTYLSNSVTSKSNSSPPNYLLNKLAQIIVSLIAADYPHVWPDAFQATILPLANSPRTATEASIAMFYRLLRALDEDVTSIRATQISAATREISIRVKDAMRDACIPTLVTTVTELLANPVHISASFDIIARYVEWVDVSLIAQERVLSPMYAVLTAPPMCSARAAAAVALRAIIMKRMDAASKLNLMQALRVETLLNSIPVDQMVGGEDEDGDADLNLQTGQAEVAALVNTIAMVALDILKEACKDSGAQRIDSQVASAAGVVAQVALPVALRFLGENADEGTSSQTLQCVGTYLNVFSRVTKKDPSSANVESLSAMAAILKVVEERCLFGEEFDPQDDTSDAEGAFAELRDILLKRVFRSVVRSFPDMCLEFLKQLFARAAKTNDILRTELALAMLLSLITASPDLPQLVEFRANIMASPPRCMEFSSDVPLESVQEKKYIAQQHQLEAVSMSFFDLVARSYRLFLSRSDSALFATVLPVFFDARGLGHRSSATVRSHAAYSLLKLARPLRSVVTSALLDAILNAVRPYMFPLNCDVSSQTSRDQMLIFETVGYLLGTDHKREESMRYLSAILQPLVEGLRTNHGPAAVPFINASGFLSKGFGGDSKPLLLLTEEPKQENRAEQTNGENERLGKDMKVQRVTPLSQEMQQIWISCLQAVLKASAACFQTGKDPALSELRSKLLFFLHRMVDTVGTPVMPYLEEVLPQLLNSAVSPVEIRDVIIVASQAITKFGERFESLAMRIYAPIVQHVHQHTYSLDPKTLLAMSEESREAVEMHRAYTYFLHAVVGTELIRILIHPTNAHLLEGVVSSLLNSAIGESLDTRVAGSVMKMSLHMLGQMVEQWSGNVGDIVTKGTVAQSPPGFSQFVLEKISTACVMSGIRGSVFRQGDYDSGQALVVLTEIVTLQRTCLKHMGQPFAEKLQNGPLSALPKAEVHSYLTGLYASDAPTAKLARGYGALAKMLRTA